MTNKKLKKRILNENSGENQPQQKMKKMKDAKSKGSQGEATGNAKLTPKQNKRVKAKERKVLAITQKKEAGIPTKPLYPKKEQKKKDVTETQKDKRIKIEKTLKNKFAQREKRKEERRLKGQYNINNIKLSVDEIKIRIEEMKSRPELTRTARRKLAVLKKKLQIEEGTYVPPPAVKVNQEHVVLSKTTKRKLRRNKNADTLNGSVESATISAKNGEKSVDIQTFKKKAQAKLQAPQIKTEKKGKLHGGSITNEGKDVKKNVKNKQKQVQKLAPRKNILKQEKVEEDDSKDEDETEEDSSEEEAEELSLAEPDVESDNDDDDEEEEEEDDEEEEEEDDEEEDEEDEETDSEEGEEESKPIMKKTQIQKIGAPGKKQEQKKKEENVKNKRQLKNESIEEKKKRFVLFVGNLPYDASTNDIRKHFLTKISQVTDVRIPNKPNTNTPRGFAYVEVSNPIDYEKGLSLHHTIFNGRKINVEYTASGSKHGNKNKEVISKNKKLHALRKAGKLAGSKKDSQKRSARRAKQKQQ